MRPHSDEKSAPSDAFFPFAQAPKKPEFPSADAGATPLQKPRPIQTRRRLFRAEANYRPSRFRSHGSGFRKAEPRKEKAKTFYKRPKT